jgi:hypothetical protein
MHLYKPGETCPKTSQYIEVTSSGAYNIINGDKRIISLECDEQFPPTRESGLYWQEY